MQVQLRFLIIFSWFNLIPVFVCFFVQQASDYVQNENISPKVLKRVTKEMAKLTKTPPEGIRVHMNEDNVTDIQATIFGPGAFFPQSHAHTNPSAYRHADACTAPAHPFAVSCAHLLPAPTACLLAQSQRLTRVACFVCG